MFLDGYHLVLPSPCPLCASKLRFVIQLKKVLLQADGIDGGHLQPEEAKSTSRPWRIFPLEAARRNIPRKPLEHHPWASNVSRQKSFGPKHIFFKFFLSIEPHPLLIISYLFAYNDFKKLLLHVFSFIVQFFILSFVALKTFVLNCI